MNKQPTLPLLLPMILLVLSCCLALAETSPAPEANTGVEGRIILTNISGGPVRQGVPDWRPLANSTFEVKKGNDVVATFTSDDKGNFRVALPPGHYTVKRKDWQSKVGFYGPFEVDVTAGAMKTVEWKCDTGMQ